MHQFLTFTITGIVTAGLYAIAASGLVVTYTTSGVFNFAHGAFGMLAAFTYWQLRVDWSWPAPIALVVLLGVLAPCFGALTQWTLLRGLHHQSEVTRLVVSVSLLFGVFRAAQVIFPPAGRRLPGFFDGRSIDLGVVNLTWHDAITVLAAIATAAVLRLVLFRTRSGVAMRGVADDRDLTVLNGTRPGRVAARSWALGATLAAAAGILLAGSQGVLSHLSLTLLVVNAYGAAMFGRLRSLAMTFVGALVLGLAQSYAIGYLALDEPVRSILGGVLHPPLTLNGLRSAIPIIALFAVLLVLPPARLRSAGRSRSGELVPSPPVCRWLLGTIGSCLGVLLLGAVLGAPRINQLGQGLALGIVMLSLVPLVGYAGQMSLAPMTFAGIGAIAMGAWGGRGNPLILLVAMLAAAAAGAVVALPALRLHGLYLALATAAFAVFMDLQFFNQSRFLPNGNRGVPRVDVGRLSFDGDRAHLVLVTTAFGLVATVIVWIRGQEFGRRLVAMKSSESACATLGVDLTVAKLEVFAFSAAIAGLGGALYGAQLRSVGPTTFQFMQSLPIVLLAVVGGVTAAGGALFGALAYTGLLLVLPDLAPGLRDVLAIAPALAGVSLGRNPNGVVNGVASFVERTRRRTPERVAEARPSDLAWLDSATGLDRDPTYAALLDLVGSGEVRDDGIAG